MISHLLDIVVITVGLLVYIGLLAAGTFEREIRAVISR